MLTLSALLIVAIALSLMGKRGQTIEYDADEMDFTGHTPNKIEIHRAEERQRLRKTLMAIGVAALVAVVMLVDWSSGGDPFGGAGAQGNGRAKSPGLVTFPGWQAGGVEIPPQGFSGHMLVRFEKGEAAGGGFMIVAPGETRKFGWRIVGGDAPSCFLRLDFKGVQTREVGWMGGYSYIKEDFGEGEHEASFTAWCPHDRSNVEFQFATMPAGRAESQVLPPSWKPAGGGDIRHRRP